MLKGVAISDSNGYFTRVDDKAPNLTASDAQGDGALQRLTRGPHKIPEGRNVGSVCANAPGVHRQAEKFRQIEIQSGVVKLGQAESGGRQNSVYPGRIDRPGRAVTLPRAARQLVKLFPIPLVPGSHLR